MPALLSDSNIEEDVDRSRHSPADLPSQPDSHEDSLSSRLPVRPRLGLMHMSSLDHLLAYHKELSAFERRSDQTSGRSVSRLHSTDPLSLETGDGHGYGQPQALSPSQEFRSIASEAVFCFSIAMTQLLSEAYISGFALVLVSLLKDMPGSDRSSTGLFWPAAILSLVIGATLLTWARVADMCGGYLPLMFGLLWLAIWSVIPGLLSSLTVLNISRAMQGFAIAALMPAVFVLLGHTYKDGRRKNIVIGIYGACAPLGFYIGFFIGGMLPTEHSSWFFLIGAALSFMTMCTTYLSVPRDNTDRRGMDLKMDWLGSFGLIAGLLLIDYALAAEPKQAELRHSTSAFSDAVILVPFLIGIFVLGVTILVEGWYAACPLLPFEFFRPRGVKAFCLACLFFYGTFGVWIYSTSAYLSTPAATNQSTSAAGLQLVLWYTPLVIGGIIFCIVGSAVTKWLSLKVLMLISGLAWIGAPLVFAVAPVPLHYWSMILPSMTCASLGTDLTFTISNMFLSASQPQKYQGVAGAVSSILFNLGVSFALPLSEIVSAAARCRTQQTALEDTQAYRASFFYATASAIVGLLICIFCFRPGPSHEAFGKNKKTKSSRASSVSEVREV